MNIEEGIFTQKELHFMVKHEEIFITPQFISDKVKLISGTFGPFKPKAPIKVPLWFALYLKKEGNAPLSSLMITTKSTSLKKSKKKQNRGKSLLKLTTIFLRFLIF